MATVSGVVERVSTNYGKYSVLINGKWYGTKQEWVKVKPVAGDMITFDDGGKNFFKNVVLGTPASSPTADAGSTPAANSSFTFPAPACGKELSIIRQNALSHATEIVVARYYKDESMNGEDLADLAIKLAKKFESYSTGWKDVYEAEDEMEELTETVKE